MKKVLVHIEKGHYPQELLDFVGKMDPLGHIALTAAFLPESDYAGVAAATPDLPHHRQKLGDFCTDRGIRLGIHSDYHDFELPCLQSESRYADLMLLSARHFFETQASEQPNAWMREMLRDAECPVLLLPDNAPLPGELILAYDGSADSMYAIRQFAYLFPELMGVHATLVFISNNPEAQIPHAAGVREFCVTHYKRFRMLRLTMKPVEFYHTWIGMMTHPWLITGSYGRSFLSEMLSKSFSSEVIREHRIPVFVAHR
ncbi:adenine nucleotide alpha hydrolase family protein [Dinghuibacter silviterrae]|uniref:Universal stress protein family protein n=1 Tax=Dinghuibacter silviterrae TaxID=1539049 RepID=A0A4R8DHU8_9BACT|nr:universal stress protein [Dinghuibacter silviterrae]TDW96706.1 hypothetical protein EDB95_4542 [Dinghuibacter silviterrae]